MYGEVSLAQVARRPQQRADRDPDDAGDHVSRPAGAQATRSSARAGPVTHWVHSDFRIDDSGGKYRLFDPADQNQPDEEQGREQQTRVSARAAALLAARAQAPGSPRR